MMGKSARFGAARARMVGVAAAVVGVASAVVLPLSAGQALAVTAATTPDTVIDSSPANPSSSASASFTFHGTIASPTDNQVVGYECRLDAGAFIACTSPRSYTGLPDGGHTFSVRSVNSETVVDPTPASYTWVIDTGQPNTTITVTPPAFTNNNSAGFQFSGSDDGGSGVDDFDCYLDGISFLSCGSAPTFVGLPDGSHTLNVSAVDAAGNADDTPASYTWVIDTVAPETSISSVPGNPSGPAVNFGIFNGDALGGSAIAGFECKLDAGAFTACSAPYSLLSLSDGSHTLQVRAVDAAGNADDTPASYTWTVDVTEPYTELFDTPDSLSTSTSATFTFSGADWLGSVVGFECRLDGGSYAACTSPHTYPGLAEGDHTFFVRAVDWINLRDSTPASYTWTVDTLAPTTEILSSPAALSAGADATFEFTGADGGSGVASYQCSIDGGSFAACTSPTTYTDLSDGDHTLAVRAIDGAGTVDTTPATHSWTIDTTAPDTTIDTAPPLLTNSAAAVFTFSGDDGAGSGVESFQCSFDGAAAGVCSSPQAFLAIVPGEHTFQVWATDNAGNADATPASFTWFIDAEPPATSITDGPAALTLDTTAEFIFDGSDSGALGSKPAAGKPGPDQVIPVGLSFECSLDAAAFTACVSPQQYSGLAQGEHTFEVRAVDPAGNADPTPEAYTWTVDSSAGPRLQATKSVSGDFVVGGTVTYTIVVTNVGSFTQQDNSTDELLDELHPSLALVSASATSGTAVATLATNIVHWNGSLAPSASVTITITATIVGGGGQSIGNQAILQFDADDNGTNESIGATDNPVSEVSGDATTFAVEAPVSTTTTTTTVSRGLPRTGAGQAVSLLQVALFLLAGGGLLLLARRRRQLTSM